MDEFPTPSIKFFSTVFNYLKENHIMVSMYSGIHGYAPPNCIQFLNLLGLIPSLQHSVKEAQEESQGPFPSTNILE